MNIVEPYAFIVDIASLEDGVKLLQKIERLGRISHRSEDAQTNESWLRFIDAVVLKHGDWSIVEHAYATVEFQVDRGISHELVRHRLFAFTQSSTRFVNFAKKMPTEYIEPPGLSPAQRSCWANAMSDADQFYQEMIEYGQSPQIARSVLPNSLATRIGVTGNLRNWRHLLLMRTTKETHPQFKQVTIPLLKKFQEYVPLLFDDIVPEARQIDNMRKPR